MSNSAFQALADYQSGGDIRDLVIAKGDDSVVLRDPADDGYVIKAYTGHQLPKLSYDQISRYHALHQKYHVLGAGVLSIDARFVNTARTRDFTMRVDIDEYSRVVSSVRVSVLDLGADIIESDDGIVLARVPRIAGINLHSVLDGAPVQIEDMQHTAYAIEHAVRKILQTHFRMNLQEEHEHGHYLVWENMMLTSISLQGEIGVVITDIGANVAHALNVG